MFINTKMLLRIFCKYVYYAGCGNFYCDDTYKESLLYKMYTVLSLAVYVTMILFENFAAMFGTFPEVEKNSAVMFAAIHNIVLAKMFFLLYHKSSIRKLNFEMATVMENFEEERVMKEQYRKVKFGITFYAVSVYLSLAAYGIESLRKVISEGAPFYTVVTILPQYDDASTLAGAIRAFFYITWLYMMLPMMSADCMPIIHLIAMAYKFITLCHHYERIRRDFEKNVKTINKTRAIQILKTGCFKGIVIHQRLLHLAEEIHRVFGIIMSLQVCESSAVAVLLLLRLAVSKELEVSLMAAIACAQTTILADYLACRVRAYAINLSPHLDITNAFMTYTFVGSLFFLLALNLWNAGEITYQASLLSNAMFNCGWHFCEMDKDRHKDIRQLVLFGCAQAQKPLILKAFGVQDLSYATFVSVARMTYSVFAVFYQRRD